MKRSIDWAAGNESIGGSVIGYPTAFGSPVYDVRRLQIATRVVLPENGTITQIGAFVGGAAADCRYAVYSDVAGEPDTLLAESATFSTVAAYDWQTTPLPSTPLTAGTYWLALSFASNSQTYFLETGGQLRYREHWATNNDYLPNWGPSDDSFVANVSIYAAYIPD